MQTGNINSASAYFNQNWQPYQNIVAHDTLYHKEMYSTLDHFLQEEMGNHPFSLVDVGCGDASVLSPVLANKNITLYTGIDEAADVLKLAAANLAILSCEKEFIADNMTTAMPKVASSKDIIFTSYAVHHLVLEDKINFIGSCQKKLKENGFLLMIDGVLKPDQTREEWLEELKARKKLTLPNITEEELNKSMEHPRKDDKPVSIATLAQIAKQQAWSDFKVIVDKGICAFVVFRK